MTTRTTTLATLFTVFAILGIALVVAQPSLTPPAGSIDETGRFGRTIEINDRTAPGDAVFRHVITAPGTYVLPGDLDTGAMSGIAIHADDVTIDLNGHTIRGAGAAGVSVPTLGPTSVLIERPRVRNGRIVGYATGIDGVTSDFSLKFGFRAGEFTHAIIEDVLIDGATFGIDMRTGRVESSTIIASERGVIAFDAVLRDCEVYLEGAVSADLAIGVALSECKCTGVYVNTQNASASTNEICFDATSTLLTDCHALGSGIGFDLDFRSVATGCSSNALSDNVNPGSDTFDSNF